MTPELPSTLVDQYGRRVDYVRLSVTDRCDFRCVYCMAENMQFAPKCNVLSLEELYDVARAFIDLGVRKIRLTGGEPLIRNNILSLVQRLGALPGLEHLALTTNGSQLQRMAGDLRQAGVTSLNISLDSLQPRKFRNLTRHGNLEQVVAGIDAALAAGFEQVRINSVVLKGRNEDEVNDLVQFAVDRNIDIAFIEEMPLGLIDEHDRALSFVSSESLRRIIAPRFSLQPLGDPTETAGPARYYQIGNGNSRAGFISPHSHNFCHLCNRVRVTAEGRLLLCLGNEHSADLRRVLRETHSNETALRTAIVQALNLKPERHYFDLAEDPQILRFMNVTGG
ncbi:MAG: GTP 3',8-cyclase MoaA [Pseudomonadota bacterium]